MNSATTNENELGAGGWTIQNEFRVVIGSADSKDEAVCAAKTLAAREGSVDLCFNDRLSAVVTALPGEAVRVSWIKW